jgi:hypothetical protein
MSARWRVGLVLCFLPPSSLILSLEQIRAQGCGLSRGAPGLCRGFWGLVRGRSIHAGFGNLRIIA